jgi:hypothetical protein
VGARSGLTRARRAGPLGAAALACVLTVLGGAWLGSGQAPVSPPTYGSAAKERGRLPRTPDGRPDFQGVWTHGTLTPFERPAELGTKAFYTEAEAKDVERQTAERRAAAARNPRPGDVGGDNEAFVDAGYAMVTTHQTSQVIEPPDGRLLLRPEAEQTRDRNLTSRDSPETMSPWDRCITRSPTLLLPAAYNNGTRIVQTPGYLVVESEMVHEARIVPLDSGGHRNAELRTWTGDPRGRWDGDTLVVDSTNYHDRGWVSTHSGSGRLRGVPNTEALHIIERFTLVDADTIAYEISVDDPGVYARPWRAAVPLHRDTEYQMFEYACQEGNQAIGLVLRGARFEEAEAARRDGGNAVSHPR